MGVTVARARKRGCSMRLMSAGLMALLVLALVGCGSKQRVVAEVEGGSLERVEGATLGREGTGGGVVG